MKDTAKTTKKGWSPFRKKAKPTAADYPPGQAPLWVTDPEHYEKRRSKAASFWRGFGLTVLTLFLVGCVVGVIALCVAATVVFSYSDTELDDRFASMDLDYSSFLYATDSATGENYIYQEIQSTSGTRIWVADTEIPDCVKKATVAIEDKRFYQHVGVDPIRTTRAVLEYAMAKVTHKSTSNIGGGSTLTQQVIKNMTGDDAQTPARKVKEMLQALYIERCYSKAQILEYYLNTVYFGHNANGISAAASIYFGKSPEELTTVEAAAIVSITKSPTYFDPFLNPENNRSRRNTVLWNMLDQGMISAEEYDEYIHTDLVLKGTGEDGEQIEETTGNFNYSYYTDMVIKDVVSDLVSKKGYTKAEANNLLYHGGLQIYICMDPAIQNIMEEYFADEENFTYKNSSKDVIKNEDGTEECPQTAMMVLDPDTGDIVGVIGGRGPKEGNLSLNRATDALRQPGSSIKPLSLYGYAIENNIITEGTVLDDVPVITSKAGYKWPSNYDGTYSGLVTVKKALSYSLNAPAAQTLQLIGIQTSFDFMRDRLHFDTLVEADGQSLSPLSVGALTKGVTLREMVTGYTIYPGQGMYAKSRSYSKVVSYDGKTLIDNNVERETVFSEQTAYIITDILSAAVTVGSSASANMKKAGFETAGKSGTTSYFKDRWFIGYTSEYLGGIWWGYDHPESLENTHHVAMWKDVMQKIHQVKGFTKVTFTKPSGIISCDVCTKSGDLPGEFCSEDQAGDPIQTLLYKDGTQPTEKCTTHHQLYVCTSSGKIAHDGCPKATLKTFLDVQRSFLCTVKVKDAAYLCPRMSAQDVLYVSDTQPVYTYMVPEGTLPSVSSKKAYTNCICTAHKPSDKPHLYTAPVSTDTSTDTSLTTTDVTTDTVTDVSSTPTVSENPTVNNP